MLLNRIPSEIETYNDINSDVVNFFFVLRTRRDELIEQFRSTPYSREEFETAMSGGYVSEMEAARRFYIRTQQSKFAIGSQVDDVSLWHFRGVVSETDGAKNRIDMQWVSPMEKLERVADRLRYVQIENRPALKVIAQVDAAHTLLYCDPPYPDQVYRGSRKIFYGAMMSDDDHRELADRLHVFKGKVAISSWRSDLYDELYADWNCHEGREKRKGASVKMSQEILWTNYMPQVTMPLFGD